MQWKVSMKELHGVCAAIVIDNQDPEGVGRVKIRIPKVSDESWARIATLMAGANRGTWFIPEVGDEVLVAFEHGDAWRPYVLGTLWNASNRPPESIGANNNKKVLRSRNGVKITLEDHDGQESFILETPGGQTITLKDSPGSVEMADSNGNFVKLEPSGITVNASAKVTIQAKQVEVSAGMVTVNAGMSKFSGVVQCDTLISNSVVSASYTPGAGNVL